MQPQWPLVEPPISADGLARAFRVSPPHSSAIYLKRNLLVASSEALVQDYLVLGFAFLKARRNVLGGVISHQHSLAKYTRRGIKEGRFLFVPAHRQDTEFRPDSVVMLRAPDVNQKIYGVPEYLPALQSALLNEAATLFRRRYYANGSHAGYILHATGGLDERDVEALKEALRKSRGPGNFRNLFVHAPNAKEGSLKILPIAKVGAEDEFLGIKTATRDDVLAAHRVPPQLIGIMPAQGFTAGNPLQGTDMFFELEISPLQAVPADQRCGVI